MKTKTIPIEIPPDMNMIFGMSHFIKTVEDPVSYTHLRAHET